MPEQLTPQDGCNSESNRASNDDSSKQQNKIAILEAGGGIIFVGIGCIFTELEAHSWPIIFYSLSVLSGVDAVCLYQRSTNRVRCMWAILIIAACFCFCWYQHEKPKSYSATTIEVTPGPSIDPKAPFGTEFILSNEGPLDITNVIFRYLLKSVKFGKADTRDMESMGKPIPRLEAHRKTAIKVTVREIIDTGNTPIQEARMEIAVEYNTDTEATTRCTNVFPFYFERAENGDSIWLPYIEKAMWLP